jgi:hypothetical protein
MTDNGDQQPPGENPQKESASPTGTQSSSEHSQNVNDAGHPPCKMCEEFKRVEDIFRRLLAIAHKKKQP